MCSSDLSTKPLAPGELIVRMAVVSALAGVVLSMVALPVVGTLGLMTRNTVLGFQNLPSDLTQVPLPMQNTVTDVNGKVIATLYAQNRIAVPLEQIAPIMQQAIIAIEDQRFLQHSGIDVKGTLRASLST